MSSRHYNIQWLINEFEYGNKVTSLFFWGHTNKDNEIPDKFCLSQWFNSPFRVNGITYQTAEHWMMAQKALLFNDISNFEKVISSKSPAEAKNIGRQIFNFNETIWDEQKYRIVRTGNIHKFNQYPEFATYLLKTNDHVLVEASPVDRIWGIGLSADNEDINNIYNWPGLNLLGFALMEVRDFLRDLGHFKYLEKEINLPWESYPNDEPESMRWRMGSGEDILIKFSNYYSSLSDRDKIIFKLSNPAPYVWARFYD